ncbi:MAG: SidJ-related pseudokinase [Desulfobacteraceae bacterium]|nr:SidJ-related pseudokinase [Desulfobacteraceae bacterium]MBC2757640.1 SidJ-related pseudokinase [Desulfobacteraceae bacterium]MBC2763885.1 SidJ-related pseudokinase [ANME-2 cluster archaeon]
MYSWNLEKERLEAELYLTEKRSDFVTTYMTVSNLQFIIDQRPEIINKATTTALLRVLEGEEHASQRQVYFLYKKAADALGAILEKTAEPVLAEYAKDTLIQILNTKNGKPCRAAAEALGAVPLDIKGPHMMEKQKPEKQMPSIPTISWHFLLQESGFPENQPLEWKGRNIIVHSKNRRRVLVLKMARPGEDPAMLYSEGMWMDFLSRNRSDFMASDDRFYIPEPVNISDNYLFKLEKLPIKAPENATLDPHAPQYTATGFIAHSDYFCYPNEHRQGHLLPKETFYKIIIRNATLLGRLTASGIIHTAPIPLFHNRVQRERRNDGGLYEWPRGGRLDRWLSSCRFPNIGKTGIRDFEHFISFNGSSRKLYEFIGTHVFSLVLIAGSYFRNLDNCRTGFDDFGNPVDARDLFDEALLKKTVNKIFTNYYKGFTGTEFTGTLPRYLDLDLDRFISRLIDEMGVDRHMEEILRIAEQNTMSEANFFNFLSSRGYQDEHIKRMKKGKEDITILTGPHLGGFNQQISIPELIEFTAAVAALCISDRYCQVKLSAS